MLTKLGSMIKITASASTLEELGVPLKTSKVIETKRPDFLYFRARAISAGDQGPKVNGVAEPNPNGNGDYFPRKELEASYQSFSGRNLFLNHESDHPIKSIGKVIDAYPVEDPETGEFYVECLSKIDRKLHPEIARKVETGELDKVSMGCSCEESKCSICGTILHSDQDEKCAHLSPGGLLHPFAAEVDFPEYGIRKGEMAKAFAINSGLTFNELSIVNVPADARAVIKTVLANLTNQLYKTAASTSEKDVAASVDEIIAQLDPKLRDEVKAAFCACQPKEATMADEKEEQKQILSKLNAYDYVRLVESLEKKAKKVESEEDNLLTRVLEKAKGTLAGKIFSQTISRIAEEEKMDVEARGKNLDVIKMFISDAFPKDKKDVWGSEHLKITREPKGWALINYVTPILFRNDKGEIILNTDRYSQTTSKIQNMIRQELKGQKYAEVNEKEMRQIIGEEPMPEAPKEEAPAAVPATEPAPSPEQPKPEEMKEPMYAKFVKNDDLLKSSWELYEDKKLVLSATLAQIWDAEYEKLSAEDKAWAISEDYGKAIVSEVKAGGVEKIADLWDVKLSKEAKGPELGPDGKQFKPGSDSSNKEHDVKTEYALGKPEGEKLTPGKGSTNKEHEVKTDYSEPKPEGSPAAPKAAPKPEEVKTDYSEPKVEGKPASPKNPEEKAHEKSSDAIKTKYVVKLPEDDPEKKEKKEASQKEATTMTEETKKEADVDMGMGKEDKPLQPTPEPSEVMPKLDEEPKPELGPEVKPEEAPAEGSVFDKLNEKVIVGEGYEAIKDKEKNEIVISKDGKEEKRVPDGFGDDLVSVMKLLRALVGLPEESEEHAEEKPLEPVEAPKVVEDIKVLEETPETAETPKLDELESSKKDELTKKAEELAKQEEELKKKEAALEEEKLKVKSEKFGNLLSARAERCQRIVQAMVTKNMVTPSDEDILAFVSKGKDLLAARKEAVKQLVGRKVRELLKVDDETLGSIEKSLEAVVKKADKKSVSSFVPHLTWSVERSETQEIDHIFRSMGTLKNQ